MMAGGPTSATGGGPANTGDTAVIRLSGRDNNLLSANSATLYYRQLGNGSYDTDNTPIWNNGGGGGDLGGLATYEWSIWVPELSDTNYQYYFEISDVSGNTRRSPTNVLTTYSIMVYDDIVPCPRDRYSVVGGTDFQCSLAPATLTATTGSGDLPVVTSNAVFTIDVYVADNIDISKADIYYRNLGVRADPWGENLGTPQTGSIWLYEVDNMTEINDVPFPETHWRITSDQMSSLGTVRSMETDTVIEYFIIASDAAGNTYTYFDDDGDDQSWRIVVTDDEGPELVPTASGDIPGATTDDEFTIYANWTDTATNALTSTLWVRVTDDLDGDGENYWVSVAGFKDIDDAPPFGVDYFRFPYNDPGIPSTSRIKSQLQADFGGYGTTNGTGLEYFITGSDGTSTTVYHGGGVFKYGDTSFFMDGAGKLTMNYNDGGMTTTVIAPFTVTVTDNDEAILSTGTGSFTLYSETHGDNGGNVVISVIENVDSMPTTVTLNSRKGTAGGFDAMDITPYIGANTYPLPDTYTVPSQDIIDVSGTGNSLYQESINDMTPWQYYIEVTDLEGNTFTYGSILNPFTITVVDDDPPKHDDLAGTDLPTGTGDTFTFYANFSDNMDVDIVQFRYKYEDESVYLVRNMNKVVDRGAGLVDDFEITLGELGLNTTNDDRDIDYIILAFDPQGNNNVVNASNPTALPWRINITDTLSPVITNSSGDIASTTDDVVDYQEDESDSFTIFIDATDNTDTAAALLFIKDSVAAWGAATSIPMTKVVDGGPAEEDRWSITYEEIEAFNGLLNTSDGKDLQYYIRVADNEPRYTYWPTGSDGDPTSNHLDIITTDNDAPIYASGPGDFSTDTGSGFTFTVTVTDNIDSTAATLYYKLDGATAYSSSALAEAPADTWSITSGALGIDTSQDDTDVVYLIEVVDAIGNTFNYSNNGSAFRVNVVDDDAPSAIFGGDITFTPNPPVTSGGFDLDIDVSDNVDVDIVYFFFNRLGVGNVFSRAVLEKTTDNPPPGADTFSISSADMGIDTTQDGNDIYYYIEAYDVEGNQVLYQNPGSPASQNVNDDTPPTFTDVTGDITVGSNEDFSIYMNISDNIDVVDAQICLITSGGGNPCALGSQVTMTKGSDGPAGAEDMFSVSYATILASTVGVVNTDNPAVDWDYSLRFRDSNSGWITEDNAGGYYAISVDDVTPPTLNSGTGNFSTFTGSGFSIQLDASDNDAASPDQFTLYYRNESMTSWSTDVQVPVAGVYTWNTGNAGLIVTDNDDVDWYYFILAEDAAGNVYNYTSQWGAWRIQVTDNDQPVGVHDDGGTERWPVAPTTGQSYAIYANYSDNVDIDRVVFNYRLQGGGGFSTHLMTRLVDGGPGSEDKFRIRNTEIGTLTDNDDTPLEYYFQVIDTQGIILTDNDGSWYTLAITDNDVPTSSSIIGDISVTTGDGFSIWIEAADNVDTTSATLYLDTGGGMDGGHAMSKLIDRAPGLPDRWTIDYATIGVSTADNHGEVWEYYIDFSDGDTAIQTDDDTGTNYEITITDNDAPTVSGGAGDTPAAAPGDAGGTQYAWVTVTDAGQGASGIAAVTIHFRDVDNDDATFTSLAMNDLGGGNYDFTKADFSLGSWASGTDVVDWYVTVTDNAGNVQLHGDALSPWTITVV